MELIKITHDNLEQEHICCAISTNKDIQVMTKKAWLKERLDEGLVFLKCNVRGKCFIEYIPAEYAWAPVEADGYMYIDCLWVSGQFKGHGYSTLLLDECIRDSKEKGKKGLVILSSKKKMGYLSDPEYLKYKGFETADAADPYFELMYLAFDKNADKPCFRHTVKTVRAFPGAWSCIIRANALLQQNMCRFLKQQPKKGMWSFRPYIYGQKTTRKMPRLPLQHFHCFAMVSS